MKNREKENRDYSRFGKVNAYLDKNEDKYRLLVETADIPIVYYALDGRFLFINTFAARNLGGEPDDFIGKSLYEIVPDLTVEIMERNQRIVELGISQQYEDVIILPSGTRWFSSIAQPLYDENGKAFAIQVISYDITKLKRQEHALRSLSKEFAEAAVESVTQNSTDDYQSLTPREKEVIQLTAMGYDRTEIGARLHISPRTAEAHRGNAMHKLGFSSKIELVHYALRNGIVPLKF